MNATKTLLCTLFLAAAASTALAQERALTRAEVQADLLMWQQSGMSRFDNGDATPDHNSPQYRAAQQRYRQMQAAAEAEKKQARANSANTQ